MNLVMMNGNVGREVSRQSHFLAASQAIACLLSTSDMHSIDWTCPVMTPLSRSNASLDVRGEREGRRGGCGRGGCV